MSRRECDKLLADCKKQGTVIKIPLFVCLFLVYFSFTFQIVLQDFKPFSPVTVPFPVSVLLGR